MSEFDLVIRNATLVDGTDRSRYAGDLAVAGGRIAAVLLGLPGCERRPPVAAGQILTTRTLGLAYLEENRLDEAAVAFRRLTELAPDEPLGFANLGLVYLRQGAYEEAERTLRLAVDLDRSDPDVRLLLAKVLELTDRVPEAREVLEGTLTDTPGHLKSHYALAQLPLDADDPGARARREEYLVRLVTLAPANLTARLLLVRTLLENGKPDDALAHLEQLHAQIPELPPQAVPFFDEVVEQTRAGRAADALRPMLVLSNFLRATGLYQAASAAPGPAHSTSPADRKAAAGAFGQENAVERLGPPWQEAGSMEQRELTIYGRTLKYFVGGKGPVVLLIHGMAGSAATWNRVSARSCCSVLAVERHTSRTPTMSF